MRELLRSNDPVLLSAVEALLRSAEIVPFIADQYASAMEGSIGAIPRRLMVPLEDETRARELLIEAGLAYELRQM